MNGPYPVDLVEVIRLHHRRADDARAIGRSHLDLHIAEEDVEVALDRRCIPFLGDGELGSERGALHSTAGGIPVVEGGRAAGEVGVESILVQTGVGRAGF